jgi:glycosyltransferase involved in cell wall biosynthesis
MTDVTNKFPLLITVITPSYNRVEMIDHAIESVLAQNYSAVEHIVIDGVSTDGTLKVLKQYSNLKVISEPDSGMYDALNKGFKLAGGEIICLLNSDDNYERNVFASIADLFNHDPDLDAVIGAARIFQELNGNEETLAIHRPSTTNKLVERLILGVPTINAWFFRRRVFEKLRGFDLHYRIASDREFLIRFYLEGFKVDVYDSILYHYRQHSGSLTFSDNLHRSQQAKLENLEIAEAYADCIQLRKVCLKWHLLLTLDMVADALRLADIPFMLKMTWRGWRRNPLWPFYFFRNALRSASRSILRFSKPH